jgi:hypothetical protein
LQSQTVDAASAGPLPPAGAVAEVAVEVAVDEHEAARREAASRTPAAANRET